MKREINQANDVLVVGGIKVLGSMEGPGLVSIKQNVQSLQNAVTTLGQRTEDYWSSIANDNIITPGEKKTLKKEWNTIQQTYASIQQMAEERGITGTDNYRAYVNKYNDLYNYLFRTIKVFDDMSENTTIPSYEEYIEKYNDYYDLELIVQSMIASSSSTYTVRNLPNLDEPGTANEIAMYQGQFYRYNVSEHKWEHVSAGSYQGIWNSLPDVGIDDYFLAGMTFQAVVALFTTKGILTTKDGKILTVKKSFNKGYLYTRTTEGWKIIINRDDYRYTIATNDLLSMNEPISPLLQSKLDSTASAATGKYLGPYETLPSTYNNGDFFLYNGPNKESYPYGDNDYLICEYSKMYKFNAPTWSEMDPTKTENRNNFMTALTDILKINYAQDGYFDTIFANAFFSNTAALNSLSVETIELKKGINKNGCMRSEDFISGSQGFNLPWDGNAEFQTGTFDNIHCNKGNFTNGAFSGTLDCGQLVVNSRTISLIELEYNETYDNDTAKPVVNYFENIFNNKYGSEAEGHFEITVSSIYPGKIVTVAGKQITKITMDRHYSSATRGTNAMFKGVEGSFITIEYELCERFSTPMAYTYSVFNRFLVIDTGDRLAVQFINLPTKKPLESGILYKNGNYISIS